jgi:hypothetical protein
LDRPEEIFEKTVSKVFAHGVKVIVQQYAEGILKHRWKTFLQLSDNSVTENLLSHGQSEIQKVSASFRASLLQAGRDPAAGDGGVKGAGF